MWPMRAEAGKSRGTCYAVKYCARGYLRVYSKLYGTPEVAMLVPYLATVAVIAYVIGSVPVGAMIAHIQGIDISQHGSGKTGTTNVLRTVGRRAAALVL